MDCLTHLFELGLQWRAFGVHRSAISRTLPPGSGGVALGDDDNVRRLMRRIILGRPPDRRVFPIWNPDDVFSLFSRWARPLPLRDVLLQIAFLVAMATCGRLSDLASLRVDSGLMTKLDSRTSHIRSSFSLRRLLSALSLLLDCVDSWRGCCVWRASAPSGLCACLGLGGLRAWRLSGGRAPRTSWRAPRTPRDAPQRRVDFLLRIDI